MGKILTKIKLNKPFFEREKHYKKCIRDLRKVLNPTDNIIIEFLIKKKNLCLRKELLKEGIKNASLTRRLDWLKNRGIINIEKESRRHTRIKLIKKNLNRRTLT